MRVESAIGGAPLSVEDAERAAAVVLEEASSDVEVVITASRSAFTRYANSQIIQNTVRHEARAHVRAVADDRSATAMTSNLDTASMLSAFERATRAAVVVPPDPDFPGLPLPSEVGRPEPLWRWDEMTTVVSPAARARSVHDILKAAGTDNAAGVVESSCHTYSVFSSNGVRCHDGHTRAAVTCLVDLSGATGWGEQASYRWDALDAEAAARQAASKAARARDAISPSPGTYEVVLEPAAVATMLEYLSYVGFGAKQMVQGESFLSSRLGEQVAAPSITISDDAFHPLSLAIGFDFEGVPKQRVAVIEEGVARRPVTDTRTARLLNTTSTGHYSGSAEFGPYASHLVLQPGDASLEELISSVDDGLLVTRFHYVNVLDRTTALLTGMTRDGTFRIRGGDLAEPIHNLRFSHSALDALAAVEGLGNVQVAFVPEYGSFGSTVVPALRISEFSFPSATSH